MKKTILLVAMMAMTIVAMAQNDTVTICHPDSVSIIRNNENVSVKVFGNGDNSDYRYSMNFGVNNSEPVVTKETKQSQKRDFDLGIPLFSSNEKKEYGYLSAEVSPALLWGCNGISGAPEADINPFASIDIWLPSIFSINYQATKNFGIDFAYGIEWRNFRMVEDKRFNLTSDKVVEVVDLPADVKSDFSRIKVLSQTLSLTARLHLKKDAYLRLGPVCSFSEGLSVKTKYKDASGKKIIDKQNNPKANLFRLEWLADVQYDCFGFWVKYSPKNVLRDGFGPQFSTTTVGVSIGW